MNFRDRALRYRLVEFQFDSLIKHLKAANSMGGQKENITINLPLPGNKAASFKINKTSIVSKELAEKLPTLLFLRGTGLTDKGTSLSLDLNAIELYATIRIRYETYLITPVSDSSHYYIVFNRKDMNPKGIKKTTKH